MVDVDQAGLGQTTTQAKLELWGRGSPITDVRHQILYKTKACQNKMTSVVQWLRVVDS